MKDGGAPTPAYETIGGAIPSEVLTVGESQRPDKTAPARGTPFGRAQFSTVQSPVAEVPVDI